MQGKEPYSHVLDDLWERTEFEWAKMSYEDKIMMITVMRSLKEDLDNYIENYYPYIKTWANLDIKIVQLNEVEPDIIKLQKMGVM